MVKLHESHTSPGPPFLSYQSIKLPVTILFKFSGASQPSLTTICGGGGQRREGKLGKSFLLAVVSSHLRNSKSQGAVT